jgi:hypothetical protein
VFWWSNFRSNWVGEKAAVFMERGLKLDRLDCRLSWIFVLHKQASNCKCRGRAGPRVGYLHRSGGLMN